MYIDHSACSAFWREYIAQLAGDHEHRSAKPDRFGFGGEPELADELAALVLAGQKRATTSLPVVLSHTGDAFISTTSRVRLRNMV